MIKSFLEIWQQPPKWKHLQTSPMIVMVCLCPILSALIYVVVLSPFLPPCQMSAILFSASKDSRTVCFLLRDSRRAKFSKGSCCSLTDYTEAYKWQIQTVLCHKKQPTSGIKWQPVWHHQGLSHPDISLTSQVWCTQHNHIGGIWSPTSWHSVWATQ